MHALVIFLSLFGMEHMHVSCLLMYIVILHIQYEDVMERQNEDESCTVLIQNRINLDVEMVVHGVWHVHVRVYSMRVRARVYVCVCV